MRLWTRLVITASLTLGAGACRDPETGEMNELKNKLCECKTAACAEQALKSVPQGPVNTSPKMQEIARAMMDCMDRITAAEKPSTDPDAPGSAAEPAGSATGSAKP